MSLRVQQRFDSAPEWSISGTSPSSPEHRDRSAREGKHRKRSLIGYTSYTAQSALESNLQLNPWEYNKKNQRKILICIYIYINNGYKMKCYILNFKRKMTIKSKLYGRKQWSPLTFIFKDRLKGIPEHVSMILINHAWISRSVVPIFIPVICTRLAGRCIKYMYTNT